MPTAKKAAVIEDLTDKLGRMNAAALIEYRGLTVTDLGDLRDQLRERHVELQVTKNTLLREAAHRNNMYDLDELFAGPTAVAFIYADEAAATKALNQFFRTARVGEIKAGIFKGGRGVTGEQFAKLADLPGREALLGQIAGLFEAPLSQLAALFNAPAQQFAYALAALEDKGGAPGTGVSFEAEAAPAVETTPAMAAVPAAEEEAPIAVVDVSSAPAPESGAAQAGAAQVAQATVPAALEAAPLESSATLAAAAESSAPVPDSTPTEPGAAPVAPTLETPAAQDEGAAAASAPESDASAATQP